MKEKKHLKSPAGDILHLPDKYTITMKGGSVSLVYSDKGSGQAGWKSLACITPQALKEAVARRKLAAFFKSSRAGKAEKTVEVGGSLARLAARNKCQLPGYCGWGEEKA